MKQNLGTIGAVPLLTAVIGFCSASARGSAANNAASHFRSSNSPEAKRS